MGIGLQLGTRLKQTNTACAGVPGTTPMPDRAAHHWVGHLALVYVVAKTLPVAHKIEALVTTAVAVVGVEAGTTIIMIIVIAVVDLEAAGDPDRAAVILL
jgi:hypothetical protein